MEAQLSKLDALLSSAAPGLPAARAAVVERWRSDADALRFHLRSIAPRAGGDRPPLVAVIGGTGTGKSTLVNRLLGSNVTAASFRRTFTSGPVAVAPKPGDVPLQWLGVPHVTVSPTDLPVRGQAGSLVVVEGIPGRLAAAATPASSDDRSPLSTQHSALSTTLVDTPDLDGDQPAHHAQADRAFRWAEAVLFVVTPEKYQMTELLPYYRLAARYAVPAAYVMNKCEEQAVVDDYVRQLAEFVVQAFQPAAGQEQAGKPAPHVFVVARDDAGYEPPAGMNVDALRGALSSFPMPDAATRRAGQRRRAGDLLGRLNDQVIAPLREDRREADRLIAALRAMEAPAAGVDVNPLTQNLRRRLQQRSILYLMGPGRILDRVRQAPTLLARLPRVAWDYLKSGQLSPELTNAGGPDGGREVPDFKSVLSDQFAVLQSRIDDALRATPATEGWLADAGADDERPYSAARIDPAEAGRIAEEELADLRHWLEKRWNATPRDTRMIETLLKHLPGGKRVLKWTEAAPYLLTVVLVTHGVFFGHLDLMILGGYGLATWISERISNEVTARTRATNARIETRFADLAHAQIERICAWLDRQTPSAKTLDQLERAAGDFEAAIGTDA